LSLAAPAYAVARREDRRIQLKACAYGKLAGCERGEIEKVTGSSGRVPPQSALGGLLARGRLRGTVAILGPAFVASVAYVDPGNFASNIAAGTRHGYLLLWVLLAANLVGMFVQALSAKVGVASGRSLPELCRERFGRKATIGLWVQAELVAMATDIAEFIGAAIALNLLFGVPLFASGLITAVVAFLLLALQQRGYRRFELAVAGMLAIVLIGFLYDTLKIGFDGTDAARGLIPGFAGTDSLLLAAAIFGATVMPHAVYLHSSLTARRIRPRGDAERRRLMRFQHWDVVLAMSLAGLVNMAMLVIAASLFHTSGLQGVDSIEGAYSGFERLVGGGAALAFAVALLASGLASSGVATLTGQLAMEGFLRRRIPLALRRAVTMAPALIVLAAGFDPSRSLVLSQVVLSFGIPFALVPLALVTGDPDVMGKLVNGRVTRLAAWAVTAAVVVLNVFLLLDALFI
jgi:manganese transport protein